MNETRLDQPGVEPSEATEDWAGIPVTVSCWILINAQASFYQWCSKPVSDRDWEEAQLIYAAYEVQADDPSV